MSKYNLVNNGTLTAGSLNWLEIESLHDGVTTSGIVSLTASGTLELELDLGDRLKVDGIRLYTSDSGQLSYINFYYKNTSTDSYSICSKSTTSEYYSATITEPSAPRYIKATISGVVIDLYEFVVYNNDYIVGFGDTGSLSSIDLDVTVPGTPGDSIAVPLYNNTLTATPATAYVAVDYTGNDGDQYLEIASTEAGPYYSIIDSDISIQDNTDNDGWRWEHGSFSNTSIYQDKVVLSSIGNAYINKVTTLPYQGYNYIFGFYSNPWSYDAAENKLYVAVVESSSTNPARLRSYSFDTNTWNYISELPIPGDYSSASICMAQHGRYLYFTMNQNETSSTFFGRYDLDGVFGNWQWLSAPGGGTWFPYLGTACSGGDYVYYISGYYANGNYRFFYRFNVNTLTWQGLSGAYDVSGSSAGSHILMYDEVRNYLYYITGYVGSNDYVQRYHISSNTWDTNYLNYISKIGHDNQWITAQYKDDKFYFKDYSHGTTMHVYDITTDQVTTIDNQFTLNASTGVNMLLLPPLDTEDAVTLLFSNINGDDYGIYGYNLPVFYDSTTYSTGIYNTPIFDITDKNMSSYFLVEEQTTEGISSITYDRDTPDGTIRVCSSDTEPIPIIEVYWFVQGGNSDDTYILKYDVNTSTRTGTWVGVRTGSYSYSYTGGATAVCRRTGRIFVQQKRSDSTSVNDAWIYTRGGSNIYYKDNEWTDVVNNYSNGGAEFTKDYGLWVHSDAGSILTRVNYDLSQRYIATNIQAYDIAVEEDGNGVWYTDRTLHRLIHLDGDGSSLNSITMNTEGSVCSSPNNGCWAIEQNYNGVWAALRYSYEGTLEKVVTLRDYAYKICSDYDGGFYYFVNNDTNPNLFHVMSNGVEDMATWISNPTKIRGHKKGVIVRSQLNENCKYVDRATGNTLATILPNQAPYEMPQDHPAMFFWSNEEHKEFRDEYGSTLLPLSYDPVWGSSNIVWTEVPKNGYFLPKRRYHRASIELQSRASNHNAYLTGVYIPKAIKVQDIQPGESKDFYMRTNIPDTVTTVDDFSGRIKAWWDVED